MHISAEIILKSQPKNDSPFKFQHSIKPRDLMKVIYHQGGIYETNKPAKYFPPVEVWLTTDHHQNIKLIINTIYPFNTKYIITFS